MRFPLPPPQGKGVLRTVALTPSGAPNLMGPATTGHVRSGGRSRIPDATGRGLIRGMDVVAIDFETANEARHSPCAVGFALVRDGRVVERTSYLIRPREMRFSPGNVRVHGLRPADVADAPEFPAVMAPYLARMAGALVIAHNASFDVGVLAATLALYGLPQPALSHACTVALAKAAWPALERYRLSTVAAHLGIRFRHHDAGEDAWACARIALAAAEAAGFPDVGSFARHLDLLRQRPAAPGFPAQGSGSIAARALRAARREAGPLPLRLAVRGSRGDRYEITLDDGTRALACTCAAGRFRRNCRHVAALMQGDLTAVIAGDPTALARLLAAA